MKRILTLGLALAAAGLLAHCSQDSKSSDQAPAPAPQRPQEVTPTVTGQGQTVAARLQIQLVGGSGSPGAPLAGATPTWQDVQPIIQANCVACHRPGGRAAPDLTSYPAPPGQLPSPQLMAELAEHVTSPNPDLVMPPTGALPQAQRDLLAAWARAGGPAAPAGVPAPTLGAPGSRGDAVDLSQETLILRWGLASAGTPTTGQRFSGAADGAYAVDLGQLAVGSQLAVAVQVTDPYGRLLVDRTLAPLTVPASGQVQATVTLPQ